MFLPNNTCQIRTVYGRSIYGGAPEYTDPRPVPCSIVRLSPRVQKTSVRADSSATKGSADEIVAEAVILFPASVNPPPESIVEIAGYTLRVTGSQPRFNLLGELDHFEISLDRSTEEF